jgi:hypothetical protein
VVESITKDIEKLERDRPAGNREQFAAIAAKILGKVPLKSWLERSETS